MTTRAQSEWLRAVSQKTVADLRQVGVAEVADRLERCAAERRNRTPDRRNWVRRSAACPWCGRTLVRRWQTGLHDWVGSGADVSYVCVALPGSGHLRDVVRCFRRALRDARDRAGRKRRVWRHMSAAGIVLPGASGRVALLAIRHAGLTRPQVAEFFARWPGSVVSAEEPHAPPLRWSQADRVALAALRRGCECLRVVLQPQGLGQQQRQTQATGTGCVEPLPVTFGWF